MDAFAASPFGLLDAHGSLRLVTDLVHEDDALCLALTCRALRDALWARFPARPAGHAHAGKRLRTRDAAVARLGARVDGAGLLDLSYPGFPDPGLRALPEGFGRLAYLPHPGLRKLDLSENPKLAALPVETLGRLGSLEELDISGCPGLALEHAINMQRGLPTLLAYLRGEAVEGVAELDLSHCGLMALPEGIGALTGLKKLDVRWNEELTALPAGLGRLRNLEELYLHHCPRLAALHDLQRQEGLPALLAHLAAQGEAAPAPGVGPS